MYYQFSIHDMFLFFRRMNSTNKSTEWAPMDLGFLLNVSVKGGQLAKKAAFKLYMDQTGYFTNHPEEIKDFLVDLFYYRVQGIISPTMYETTAASVALQPIELRHQQLKTVFCSRGRSKQPNFLKHDSKRNQKVPSYEQLYFSVSSEFVDACLLPVSMLTTLCEKTANARRASVNVPVPALLQKKSKADAKIHAGTLVQRTAKAQKIKSPIVMNAVVDGDDV